MARVGCMSLACLNSRYLMYFELRLRYRRKGHIDQNRTNALIARCK